MLMRMGFFLISGSGVVNKSFDVLLLHQKVRGTEIRSAELLSGRPTDAPARSASNCVRQSCSPNFSNSSGGKRVKMSY